MIKQNNNDFMKNVGEKLQAARLKRKITQVQAAEAAGISQPFLSAIENGKKTACTRQIICLIKFYEIPYEEVFGEAEKRQINNENDEPEDLWDLEYVRLLEELVKGSKSQGLFEGLNVYLKLCVYVMFRTLYMENPKNSEKIFSIEYEKAMLSAQRIIQKSPREAAMLSRNGDFKIKSRNFEVNISKNDQLREFIKECEEILKS